MNGNNNFWCARQKKKNLNLVVEQKHKLSHQSMGFGNFISQAYMRLIEFCFVQMLCAAFTESIISNIGGFIRNLKITTEVYFPSANYTR